MLAENLLHSPTCCLALDFLAGSIAPVSVPATVFLPGFTQNTTLDVQTYNCVLVLLFYFTFYFYVVMSWGAAGGQQTEYNT